jgi:hypothetical protein
VTSSWFQSASIRNRIDLYQTGAAASLSQPGAENRLTMHHGGAIQSTGRASPSVEANLTMTLEDYLREAYPDLKIGRASAAFAAKIGTSRQNIDRYRTYQRRPLLEMVAVIENETDGLVTATDHLPPELAQEIRKRKR